MRLLDAVHPSWVPAMEECREALTEISRRLDDETRNGIAHAPSDDRIMRAFSQPLEAVRVVIVGQDPYPTAGHAVGLAFSTARDVRPLPRSLTNIYTELHDDLGIEPASHGDLSRWAEHGVLLLNTALSVSIGEAGSHRSWPWREVTGAALHALATRGGPLVAILWGNDAKWAKPILGGVNVIESPHPSPLSARRGFFGSRPFSRANSSLVAQSGEPIDWRV